MAKTLEGIKVKQDSSIRPSLPRRFFGKLVASWNAYFKHDIKPHALENSPLGTLPLELILLIADFLPTESAVALSFSCRPIREILGPLHLKALQSTSEEGKSHRAAFLSLLENDLPGYVACQACAKLHPISKSFARKVIGRDLSPYELSKLASKPRLPCSERDSKADTYNAIHATFNYVVFQMTMKRHRLGLDCTRWLKFLSYNHTAPAYGHMYQDVSEARMIGGSLYVRTQHIAMLQPGRPIVLPTSAAPRICFHFGRVNGDPWLSEDQHSKRILQCRISHWDSSEHCPTCSGIMSCRSCPTEFQFDIKDFGEHGVALIFTKWQGLGAGLDYNDPTWKSHVYSPELFSRRRNRIQTAFEEGSISTAFQNEEPFRPDAAIPMISKHFWIDLPLLFQGKRWAWKYLDV